MSKIFYTADLHFGHTNAIYFDKRPFKNADEMDEAIIRNYISTTTNARSACAITQWRNGRACIITHGIFTGISMRTATMRITL